MELEIRNRKTIFHITALALFLLLAADSWAQDDAFPQDRPRSSVGKMKAAPAKKTSPQKKPASHGGIVQQFKSLSNNLFGSEEEETATNNNIPQPPPMEARRRPFRDTGDRNTQRNEAARGRGMPAPPPVDPPSLGSTRTLEALPPVVQNNSRSSMDTAVQSTEIGSDLQASPPQPSASSESSSRRKAKTFVETPVTTRQPLQNTESDFPRIQDQPSSDQPSSDEPLDSTTAEEDFVAVPKKSIPTATKPSSSPVATPSTSRNQGSEPTQPQLSLESDAPSPSVGSKTTPSSTSPSSSKGTLLQMALPRVELSMIGPSALRVNETTSYEVIAFNRDQAKLNGLVVRMVIPPSVQVAIQDPTLGEAAIDEEDGIRSVVWQLEELDPNQQCVLRLDISTARPEHFAIDLEWTALPQTGQVDLDVQQPMLQLALEGPSETTFGRPELYRLRVKNPGNATIKDVSVNLTAEPYGRNSTRIGEIPAGSERTIEVELTFQQAGMINLLAEAQSKEFSIATQEQIEVNVRQAQLVPSITGPEQHYQGSIADYEIAIVNQGAIASEQVQCSLNLPKGSHVVSLPEGARLQGQDLLWTIPRIESGSSYSGNMQLQMDNTGDFTLQLKTDGSAGGQSHCETIVRVEAISDLKLSVSDPVAPAPVGKPVVYELTLVNRGSKPATGVRVLAQFSNGIEPIRASGHANQVIPGQVVFDPIESVGPGKEITLRITAQASETGMHRFRAEVTCDDSDTQLLHEESTRYLATTRSEAGTGAVRR